MMCFDAKIAVDSRQATSARLAPCTVRHQGSVHEKRLKERIVMSHVDRWHTVTRPTTIGGMRGTP